MLAACWTEPTLRADKFDTLLGARIYIALDMVGIKRPQPVAIE